MRRPAGLLYLLASTYLVARLITSLLWSGAWGLDLELVVLAVVVSLVQVALLESIPPLRRALTPPDAKTVPPNHEGTTCGS